MRHWTLKMKTFVLVHWICIAVHVKTWDSQGPVLTDLSSISRLASAVYRQSALIILFDEKNERLATEFSTWRISEQQSLLFSVKNIRVFLKQYIHHILTTSTSIEDIRHSLNFVVICRDCLIDVLDLASTGDSLAQQTVRHFSTWLFITDNLFNHHHTCIDNVALIIYKDPDNPNTKTESDKDLVTLQWMPEGRRWSAVNISSLKNDDIFHHVFPNVQRGLNGACLLISTLQWVPETMRTVVNGNVTYVGASIDIIRSLSVVFNFTFEVTEPRDGSWGIQLDNGSWTGIIGMLERQEIDMTGCPYAFSADRAKVMDFTPASGPTDFVIIYTKKKDRLYFWKFLIAGFSWEIYTCGAAIFLCCVPIYLYITHISKRFSPVEQPQLKLDVIFVFTSIALRQDIPNHRRPHLSSERAMIFSWAFFCFLITAIYSGGLVASATVDRLEVPFDTIEELVNQNEYTVSVFNGYLGLEVIKNSRVAVYQKLYDKMKDHILNETNDYLTDGLNLIINDSFALLIDFATFQAMRAFSCDISVMKERLFYSPASLGFPRHSPLRKLFLESFSWMSDTGMFATNLKIWQDDPKPCGPKNEISSNKLELKHLSTLFVVCVCGVVSSLVTLMLERRRFKTHKDN